MRVIVQGVEVREGALLHYKRNRINCELQIEAIIAMYLMKATLVLILLI